MTLDGWPERYPPEALRTETEAMSEVWVEVLTAILPRGSVRGVYRKGSAQKPWHSRIDYVPALSDVDVHVRLRDEADAAPLDDLDAAVEVNRAVRQAFLRRVPAPLHLPKPQVLVVNRLERTPGIAPSPASTVATIYGEPYEDRTLTAEEYAEQRARDREQLLQLREFLAALPGRVLDRPGPHALPLLHEVNWRVSPTAPRALSLLGAPYAEVWSMNRTQLVAALEERGQSALAEAYAAYYLAGWRLFLEPGDDDAALDVLRAGCDVLRLGLEAGERA